MYLIPDYIDEENWSLKMTLQAKGLQTIDLSINVSSNKSNQKPLGNPKKPQYIYIIPPDKVKFDSFNLFKELPENSQLYYGELSDEIGLGKSIGIGSSEIEGMEDDEERGNKLFQMFIKLNPNLCYDSKRKYLKSSPEKHERLYRELFVEGVPLNSKHTHFKGGKNEQTIFHLEHKEATKYIAGFLGLPYHSSLHVKDYQSDLTQKTHFLHFDSSGLDISSIEFFEQVLWITAHLGLRGKDLLDTLPNAKLVQGRETLYENNGDQN